MGTNGAAIEILGLEKTYYVGFWRKREKVGLYPLTLTVQAGEILGYLGPNGAGKTTTLKLLLGLASPTGGTAIENARLEDGRGRWNSRWSGEMRRYREERRRLTRPTGPFLTLRRESRGSKPD